MLKRVDHIVCPIIVCDGNNCGGVVIDVCGKSCLPGFFGSRPRVVIWAYPNPFHWVEKDGSCEPKITSLSYEETREI